MLVAIVFDNLCAGIRLVNKSFSSALFFKFIYYFFRKTVWKSHKRLFRYNSCHFPVACGGVFADRKLPQPAVWSIVTCRIIKSYSVNCKKSHFLHIRHFKIFWFGYCFYGACALITKRFCIRCFAHTERVKYNYKATHYYPSFIILISRLVPSLFAPNEMNFSASSNDLIPPAALIFLFFICSLISLTSSNVAPPVENPVDVLI